MTVSLFDATVRAHNRMVSLRRAAGWAAPCGTPETDWEDSGYPFPEETNAPAQAGNDQ